MANAPAPLSARQVGSGQVQRTRRKAAKAPHPVRMRRPEAAKSSIPRQQSQARSHFSLTHSRSFFLFPSSRPRSRRGGHRRLSRPTNHSFSPCPHLLPRPRPGTGREATEHSARQQEARAGRLVRALSFSPFLSVGPWAGGARRRMASSRVMASSSPPQPAGAGAGAGSSSDLARFRSSSGIGSMNMDDIIRNIYGPEAVNAAATGGGAAEPSPAAPLAAARRTSEEVWKEISAAGGLAAPTLPPPPPPAAGAGARGTGGAAEMTLEDFLARDSGARAAAVVEGNMALGFPVPDGDAAAGVGGGRGSRKRAMVDPEDRAVMQRQKRMIKNRESAARSRDRKQAYVAELESQVTQLEEEQAELLREQEERRQKRLKELMERAVPVIRKKPPQDLRRTNSMEW